MLRISVPTEISLCNMDLAQRFFPETGLHSLLWMNLALIFYKWRPPCIIIHHAGVDLRLAPIMVLSSLPLHSVLELTYIRMYWAQNRLSTHFAVSTVTTFVFFCCLTVDIKQLCTHRSKRRNSYNVIMYMNNHVHSAPQLERKKEKNREEGKKNHTL